MLHRITILSAALVLALLVLPLSVLPEEQSVPEPEPQADQAEGRETAEDALPAEEDAAQPESQETSQPEPQQTSAQQAQDEPAEQTGNESDGTTLRVLMPDGTVETMGIEDYLWGVLAAEMPVTFRGEALKAQAVAARTYTLYQLAHPKDAHPEADVCTDYSCCQAWISREDRLAQWPEEEQQSYAGRISAALRETKGQVLTWEGEPILAVFHASSADRTRSAQSVWGKSVPYLVSVDSPEGEGDTPNYYSVVTLTSQEFSDLFLAAYPEADLSGSCESWFSVPETDDSGAPASFTVGGVTVTAQALRSLCGLRSATFEVECAEDKVTFYVTGYGHGVGMSQYGANALANQGMTYDQILAHYYPGTSLETADTSDS
ncbi:MAG: stage II sporulation protein D [Candidatus Onthomonas sp.]